MSIRRIIPCLDLREGRVVKGIHFESIRDAGDPVEAARAYQREGADELVMLDINATHEGRSTTLDVIARVAKEITIPFAVGGGISTTEHMQALLDLGAAKVSINSSAVNNPALIEEAAKKFGSKRLVVAIDVKQTKPGHWAVLINGGRMDAGLEAVAWARECARLGAGEILLTSMDMDGVCQGYDLAITRAISEAVSIPVVASGGAGKLEHFVEAITQGKADAVLAATLFHDKILSIRQVKEALAAAQIPVSPIA